MPDTVGFQDFSEIGNPRFLHLEEISDMEVVNKTTYKRNENKAFSGTGLFDSGISYYYGGFKDGMKEGFGEYIYLGEKYSPNDESISLGQVYFQLEN